MVPDNLRAPSFKLGSDFSGGRFLILKQQGKWRKFVLELSYFAGSIPRPPR